MVIIANGSQVAIFLQVKDDLNVINPALNTYRTEDAPTAGARCSRDFIMDKRKETL